MANKKKLIGLGIGLACLILLVVLLLTRCGGNAEQPNVPGTSAPADVTGTVTDPKDAATAAPTAEPTEVSQEETVPETEPVEETEPTEETEPAEEDQGSTSGGNSRPGGSGGFTGSNTDSGSSDSEDEEEGSEGGNTPEGQKVADPGTETNAYTEVLGEIPDEIATVKIPAEQTISYNVYNAAGSTLTIEDEDAFVVYNGETYEAENGAVTVVLAEADEGDVSPVSLQIGSNADEEKAYTLKFAMPLGTAQNPEILEDISHILVVLPEGHNGSYYYGYNVVETGKLTMKFISMDPEDGSCEIILNRVRTDAEGETVETAASVNGEVSMDVEYGDFVTIQVLVEPPVTVAEVYIQGFLAVTTGTEENPIALDYPDNTIVVPAGKTVYYTANVAGASMTVTGEDVSAIAVEHNDFIYVAENNVVSLEASASGRGSSCLFAITNSSHKAVECTVTFAFPVGHSMNPAELVIGENTAAIQEGSIGYYYSWTASQAGKLTVTMDESNTAGWFYSVSKPDSGVYGDNHYNTDETVVATETIEVQEGDVVEIIVNTHSETGVAPAGDVRFTAELEVGTGTEANPHLIVGELETDLTVGAGETLWVQCRATSMIFTLEGSDVEVAHDGKTHGAENGLVTFTVTGGSMYEPPVFAISNLSAEEKTYHVAFTYPVGTSENPQEVDLEEENSVELEKDSIGYFYGFVAEKDGLLTVTMDVEKNTAGWQYCINNKTAETYGEIHSSGDKNEEGEEELVPAETLEVKAGDEIEIVLGTYAEGGVAPAGTVYFTAEFISADQVSAVAEEMAEAAEPEATEPEATEPEATEPEVTEPEATEPEAAEPEATEPEAAEPEATEPEATEPEATEPEAAEPEVTEPEVTEPEAAEPEAQKPAEESEPETEAEI